jgi:hypothetical protein
MSLHQRTYSIIAALVTVAASHSARAVITAQSVITPTIGETGSFTDGGNDYFGIVDNAGQIAGGSFSTATTSPIFSATEGTVAGRDIDDAGSKPATRTATWSLNVAGIANSSGPFTNINFSGHIAATENGWNNFDDALDDDFVTFSLKLDGFETDIQDFRPNITNAQGQAGSSGSLALDTNGDEVGDGTAVAAAGTGQTFSLTGVTANTSIELVMTVHANAGDQEFWASGALTADIDVVPEPSSTLMLSLAGGLLALRRRR